MARGLRDYDLDRMSAYQLIELLDEMYPTLNPEPDVHSHAYIMHCAGQRKLIETLLTLKEREQNGKRNAKESV